MIVGQNFDLERTFWSRPRVSTFGYRVWPNQGTEKEQNDSGEQKRLISDAEKADWVASSMWCRGKKAEKPSQGMATGVDKGVDTGLCVHGPNHIDTFRFRLDSDVGMIADKAPIISVRKRLRMVKTVFISVSFTGLDKRFQKRFANVVHRSITDLIVGIRVVRDKHDNTYPEYS
ncbi:hypothetical protein C8J57DRAFT_1231171 [Mycena rebaudengoi]|nr:hypothetical protein C8J57DRAFT_1231171 [Mycena rebaudengoi]